nr:CoA-transferase [uncultured Rhodopila sp.]
MLMLPTQPGPAVRPLHNWKTIPADDAAAMIGSGSTVAVGWLGDSLASALKAAFVARRQPSDLTVVYAVTHGSGRTHGLNMLAEEGLVRRVIGGQWHPVPGLHAMALSNRIEAYSLPVGIINRLFRDTAAGLSSHLSRSGIGTFTDPRHGGGKLNTNTLEDLVRLVHAAGEEALLFRTFPIDAALIAVAFVEGTGEIAMTRDAMTIARAARKSGGLVIAQPDRIGTLDKLPPGQVVAPDTLIDVLVATDGRDRAWETFAPFPAGRTRS